LVVHKIAGTKPSEMLPHEREDFVRETSEREEKDKDQKKDVTDVGRDMEKKVKLTKCI